MEILKENLIIKSNKLIEAKYNLNLNEQKILLYAVSKIDRNSEMPNIVEFSANEYMNVSGKDYKGHGKIKDAVDGLMEQRLEINEEDGSWSKFQWVSSASYESFSGIIQIEFSIKLMPFLIELKNRFTRYQFKNVVHMKSSHSIRLYELLKQQEFASYRKISISKLREYLMLEDSYVQTSDLIKRVIEPAVKEINEQTDIDVNYEKMFKGRSISGLAFVIESKDSDFKLMDDFYKETYDIKQLKEKMGIEQENFSSVQVMTLYEAVIRVADGYEWDIYAKLNYKYVKEKEKEKDIRNIYSYLLSAYKKDFAGAIKFIELKEMLKG